MVLSKKIPKCHEVLFIYFISFILFVRIDTKRRDGPCLAFDINRVRWYLLIVSLRLITDIEGEGVSEEDCH